MFIAVLTLSGVGYPFAQLQTYFLLAMDHVAALLIVLCFPTQYMHKGDNTFNLSNVMKNKAIVLYLMQQIKDHSIRCFTWIHCTIDSSWHNALENKNKGINMF